MSVSDVGATMMMTTTVAIEVMIGAGTEIVVARVTDMWRER